MGPSPKKPRANTADKRRTPRQERSRQLVSDLLEGASVVLERRGSSGFTTNHVAEATGASVGSLYQYYPNKSALLEALHERDGKRLWASLQEILADESTSADERLSEVLRVAFQVQADASSLHAALGKSEPGEPPLDAELLGEIAAGLANFVERTVSPTKREEPGQLAEQTLGIVFAALDKLSHEGVSQPDVDQLREETRSTVARLLGWT